MKQILSILILSAALSACNNPAQTNTGVSEIELGKKLFNDVSLSKDGTQSCASCHNSSQAFIDTRVNASSIDGKIVASVSLGQDGHSLGDINVPSIAYAAFVPEFHYNKKDAVFVGGLFLDGRAKNLQAQAKQPFINPIEMQTNSVQLVQKVKEKYQQSMQQLYGKDIFNNPEKAFNAIANSIAAFEKTAEFSPFNSKFDLSLKGKVKLSEQELLGQDLFIDEKKGNCAACHPVPTLKSTQQDSLFTDFTYDNLGVPANQMVRKLNQKGTKFVDNGLFNNPAVNDAGLKGAFRVTSLRNIALTAPYMHNGVFKDLKTVVHFYNTRDVSEAINPETEKPWQTAEIDATKNTEELGDLGLSDKEEQAIVAFLQTLTDASFAVE
jgi:cytochrome c peroxidase